ncbi:cytochrome-c peroxidase [Nonlabens marinus]|uniref:Methylamine utilization protein MauG n=1 Tax=Nonlabens marinus S1-08 TaxID=1454201 RepID=W8VVW7_9FLAO|nr:cytochrome-c peroxidase [Nonlabens marinus]BAO55818.1 cytochrome c551 peroxidase [Nonlabens marinus S1-08]
MTDLQHIKIVSTFFLIAIMAMAFTSCKNTEQAEGYSEIDKLRALYGQPNSNLWPEPQLDSLVDRESFEDLGLLPKVKFPVTNPYSKSKKELGKMLFFDGRLSETGHIACASCHNPELAWTDNLTRSFGHMRQRGRRNAMTILNSAYADELFWDGRAESLEDQARFPIPDKLEMNSNLDIAVENIAAVEGYKPMFKDAFGDEEVTLDRILDAIATFERTVKSPKSKFDKFISGDDSQFSDQELQGLHLFRTKAQCINCHNTPYFSDNQYHNDGQHLFGTKDEDLGRYYVTNDLLDLGKFRTPSLRETTRTGPWMHHGHFPNLVDVLDLYNLGNPAPIQSKYIGIGRDSLIPQPSPLLKPLGLSREEINAVIAFLGTLSTNTERVNLARMPE